MDNPAGNRANHRPSVCLQSSVGRRVSTACLINDTDHQYLKSKHQKRQVHPSASTYPWGKPASGYWKRTLEYQKQKLPKSQNIKKKISGQFANNLCNRETEFLEWYRMSRHSFLHLFYNNMFRSTLCNHSLT